MELVQRSWSFTSQMLTFMAAVTFAGGPRNVDLLVLHGYEPRQVGRTVLLTNCPFHSLARSHTQLACQMNHALLDALAQSIAPDLLEVRLEPGKDRCWVTLSDSS